MVFLLFAEITLMELEKLLDELIDKLNEEKDLLVLSLKDRKKSEALLKVVEEKKQIIERLSKFSEEEISKFEDKVIQIKKISEENLALALNGIQFIEEIFDAIFEGEEIKTYSSKGDFPKESKGFINKKI